MVLFSFYIPMKVAGNHFYSNRFSPVNDTPPDGIEQNVLISGWSEEQSNPVTLGAIKRFPINGVSI